MMNQVLLYQNHVILYKTRNNTNIFVVANKDENELIVDQVLSAVDNSICHLVRNEVNKQTIIDNLDLVLLTFDEVVDMGIIFETDPDKIVNRVVMRDDNTQHFTPMHEDTIMSALRQATGGLFGK